MTMLPFQHAPAGLKAPTLLFALDDFRRARVKQEIYWEVRTAGVVVKPTSRHGGEATIVRVTPRIEMPLARGNSQNTAWHMKTSGKHQSTSRR